MLHSPNVVMVSMHYKCRDGQYVTTEPFTRLASTRSSALPAIHGYMAGQGSSLGQNLKLMSNNHMNSSGFIRIN